MNKKDITKARKQTEDTRFTYQLPDTEMVVQDYLCTLKSVLPAHMIITYNYICFSPRPVGKSPVALPFNKVKEVKKSKGRGIKIITKNNEEYNFSKFAHRDEAFVLLMYLSKHTPIFIKSSKKGISAYSKENISNEEDIKVINEKNLETGDNDDDDDNDDDISFISSIPAEGRPSSSVTGGNFFGESEVDDYGFSSGIGRYEELGTRGLLVKNNTKVDVESAARAVQYGLEAKGMGVETLENLHDQGETLDRIESKTAEFHEKMDEAEFLLRGIESVPGMLLNGLGGERVTKKKFIPSKEMLLAERKESMVDIPVLIKHKSCMFQYGILRFTRDNFAALDYGSRKIVKSMKYDYREVMSIIVRARSLHIDIKFHTSRSRFRVCSSYIQAIVNELSLRSKTNIYFEPGVEQFGYGDPELVTRTDSGNPKDGVNSSSIFFGKDIKTSDIISDTVPDDISRDLKYQDESMAMLSDLVGDLHVIGRTMGDTLDTHNQQLKRINDETRRGNERATRNNHRIDRMLNDQPTSLVGKITGI